jgi:transposase-like protein
MAKQQRDPAKEQYWRGMVAEFQGSGQSVREFCRTRPVTEASFYAWRRELQRRDEPIVAKPAFVPVTVVSTPAMLEVRCPSGHVITLPNANVETLRHLFAALTPEEPC